MSTTLTAPSKQSTTTTSNAEAEIRTLIHKWARALEAKDVPAMMADYAPDAVLFDVKPPYKIEGPAAIRAMWESCLPYFPAAYKSVHRDVHVETSGDLAFVRALHKFEVPGEPNHPAGLTWVRVTACYRRTAGRWLVAHEHVSVPFDPITGQVAFITDPDAAAAAPAACCGANASACDSKSA